MNKRSEKKRSMLHDRVEDLKVQYGDNKLKKAMKQFLKSRKIGRPKKWSETRLYALWLIVQCHAQLDNITVDASCSKLESLGGIFECFDYELKLRTRAVHKRTRIHRLYYNAETAFGNLELHKETGSNQASKLREKLRQLAAEMALKGIFMCPVISIAEGFVLECIEYYDASPTDIIESGAFGYVQGDFAAVKILPDGGVWQIKGI